MSMMFPQPAMDEGSQVIKSEQDCLRDAMQRISGWLDILEERVSTLLRDNDLEKMKPVEREQAANRHIMLAMRLLSLRQECTKANKPYIEDEMLDSLLRELEAEGKETFNGV